MNNNEIAWVSGWASDISIWEEQIYKTFVNYSHRFIDYYDLLPNPESFWDENPRIEKAEIVIAWSMGTLALLKNLNKKNENQKWILICPIADFCAEDCWNLSAIKTMRNGILINTKQTLMAFSDLMGTPTKEEREFWVENAMRYSPKQLANGLDFLMQEKIDLINANAKNIEFIFGEQDRVVPLAQKKQIPFESITVCENLNHWLPNYFKELEKSSLFQTD